MKPFNCILFFGFIFTNCFSQNQIDTITINHTQFVTMTKAIKGEFRDKDTIVYFYRIEGDRLKYLLKHYMYKWSADCNNEFIDRGSFTISADRIIFMTEYSQQLNDPIPLARKQVYVVNSTGKLLLVSDLEQGHSGEWKNITNSAD